jgi:hypothetical protein
LEEIGMRITRLLVIALVLLPLPALAGDLPAAADNSAPALGSPLFPADTAPLACSKKSAVASAQSLLMPAPQQAAACFCQMPFNYCRVNYGAQYYCNTDPCGCEHI